MTRGAAGLALRSARETHRADGRRRLSGVGSAGSRPGAIRLHDVRVSSRLLVQAPWPESVQMGVPVWAQLPRLARAIQLGSMLALLARSGSASRQRCTSAHVGARLSRRPQGRRLEHHADPPAPRFGARPARRLAVLDLEDRLARLGEGRVLAAVALLDALLDDHPVEVRGECARLRAVVLQSDAQLVRVRLIRQPRVEAELIGRREREAGVVLKPLRLSGSTPSKPFARHASMRARRIGASRSIRRMSSQRSSGNPSYSFPSTSGGKALFVGSEVLPRACVDVARNLAVAALERPDRPGLLVAVDVEEPRA